MNISNHIYTSLTPLERVRAAISAIARDDKQELQKLKQTCAMRVFRITDPDYSDRMSLIMMVLLAMEIDLRGHALDFLIARRSAANLDDVEKILVRMATYHAGLRLFAEAEGIDLAELEACGPPRHYLVAGLLKFIVGEEDEKEAAEIAEWIRNFVQET